MKKRKYEDLSESFGKKEIEKIFPFCISLVATSIKESENEWMNKVNNNDLKKNIVQSLFSLLNYEILIIQQISKYYKLYINNLDKDNNKLINQIISLNKDLMNKKIKAIINESLYSNNNNETNLINYKKLKYNGNQKYDIKTIYINMENNKELQKDSTFNDAQFNCIKNNNNLNRNFSFENKRNNLKEKNMEENKDNSLISNINFNNTLKNNNKINSNDIKNNKDNSKKPKLSNTISNFDKLNILYSPYQRKKIIESPKDNKIKIKLADKYVKNNIENNDYATISNISRQSKINFSQTQSTFNFRKKENANTISVEENPVRKVKNIIINAKNTNFLFIRSETPDNIRLLNNHRHSTFNNHRNYILSEENSRNNNKDLNRQIKKNNSRNILITNTLTDFYKKFNDKEKIIKKSMSNKNFSNGNINQKINEVTKKTIKTIINKDRKSNQILKDGMKKIEKRLNSKEAKKEFSNNKSNENLTFIKKATNKSTNINKNKKISKNFFKNYN